MKEPGGMISGEGSGEVQLLHSWEKVGEIGKGRGPGVLTCRNGHNLREGTGSFLCLLTLWKVRFKFGVAIFLVRCGGVGCWLLAGLLFCLYL